MKHQSVAEQLSIPRNRFGLGFRTATIEPVWMTCECPLSGDTLLAELAESKRSAPGDGRHLKREANIFFLIRDRLGMSPMRLAENRVASQACGRWHRPSLLGSTYKNGSC
jgi:hypothetical protein